MVLNSLAEFKALTSCGVALAPLLEMLSILLTTCGQETSCDRNGSNLWMYIHANDTGDKKSAQDEAQ